MAKYGYIFGSAEEHLHLFEGKPFSPGIIKNITIEDTSDLKQPKFDLLIQALEHNDELVVPSIEHIGHTMKEVILSLDSLALAKVKLTIINPTDRALLKNLGSLSAASKKMTSFVELQTRVLKNKKMAGIKRAKEADAALKDWHYDQRKYKGRIGADDRTKLKITGMNISGMGPTEITENEKTENRVTKHGKISRGTVYNYIKETSEKFPVEVAIFKYLNKVENFKILPFTTYTNLPNLIIDLYVKLAKKDQKEIRESVFIFNKTHPEVQSLTDLKALLTKERLSETLPLSNLDKEEAGKLNQYVGDLIEIFSKLNIEEPSQISVKIADKTGLTMQQAIKNAVHFGEEGFQRLLEILGKNKDYKNESMQRLMKQMGLSAKSEYSDIYLNVLMGTSADALVSSELTICHFID